MNVKNPEGPVQPNDGIARRTILQGSAWAVPTIMAATAVPAASASVDDGGGNGVPNFSLAFNLQPILLPSTFAGAVSSTGNGPAQWEAAVTPTTEAQWAATSPSGALTISTNPVLPFTIVSVFISSQRNDLETPLRWVSGAPGVVNNDLLSTQTDENGQVEIPGSSIVPAVTLTRMLQMAQLNGNTFVRGLFTITVTGANSQPPTPLAVAPDHIATQ